MFSYLFIVALLEVYLLEAQVARKFVYSSCTHPETTFPEDCQKTCIAISYQNTTNECQMYRDMATLPPCVGDAVTLTRELLKDIGDVCSETCTVIDCARIPSLYNTHSGNLLNVGAVIKYKCFQHDTNQDIRCVPIGQWTQTYPCTARPACDDGWFHYSADNSWYKYFNEPKTWFNAKSYCESQEAHLVIVLSIEENSFLKSKLRQLVTGSLMDVWTDGTDIATEGVFVWNHTGESFAITDWDANQPDNNRRSEDCAVFRAVEDFAWNDAPCNRAFPFMCEKE